MAETFTSDNSVPAEVMESQEADIADSLRVGEEIEAAHEQRLAGKYNSTEELEAAYLELQQKLGSQEKDVQAEPEETTETDWLAQAQQAMQESGELSEELAAQIKGMDPMQVFNALQGDAPEAKDLTSAEVSSIYKTVGGEETYSQMITWAQENLSEAEIGAYDSMIGTADMSQINLALRGLYSQYTDAMGNEGETIQGKPAAAQAAFRSQAELVQAMSDPRYDNDPAYRQDVIDKLDRSDLTF
jgi:hypothetical protein